MYTKEEIYQNLSWIRLKKKKTDKQTHSISWRLCHWKASWPPGPVLRPRAGSEDGIRQALHRRQHSTSLWAPSLAPGLVWVWIHSEAHIPKSTCPVTKGVTWCSAWNLSFPCRALLWGTESSLALPYILNQSTTLLETRAEANGPVPKGSIELKSLKRPDSGVFPHGPCPSSLYIECVKCQGDEWKAGLLGG